MAINSWSRNRKLVLTWSTFLFLFLTTAVVLLVTASIWRGGDQQLGARTLQRLVWTDQFSNASVVLGVVIIVTCAIGVAGFWQGHGKGNGDNSTGLIIFNFVLLVTIIITLIIGSIIWFFTLTERADYAAIWRAQPIETQEYFQNSMSCCGYWNASAAGLLSSPTGFCASIGNATEVTPCVTPMTAFADRFLNNVFSTIYGFTAIESFLFLTTCCLIINRTEEERFRRIDEKRGVKGGFV